MFVFVCRHFEQQGWNIFSVQFIHCCFMLTDGQATSFPPGREAFSNGALVIFKRLSGGFQWLASISSVQCPRIFLGVFCSF